MLIDGLIGLELLHFRGVGLEQQDRRARFTEGGLDRSVGFLGERAFDGLERGLLMRLENGLSGLEPRPEVGRLQCQAAKRSIDAAAQTVIEADRTGAIGHASDRLASRGIDRFAVDAGDVNFLAVRIGHQATVLERTDDRKSQLVAAAGDHADRLFRIGIIVVGEFTDRVLEWPRHHREHHREHHQ